MTSSKQQINTTDMNVRCKPHNNTTPINELLALMIPDYLHISTLLSPISQNSVHDYSPTIGHERCHHESSHALWHMSRFPLIGRNHEKSMTV